MTELGREARAIVRAAREGERLGSDERRRLRQLVLRRVGAAAAVATAATSATATATGSAGVLTGALGAKLAGFLAVLGLGGALWVWSGGEPSRTPSTGLSETTIAASPAAATTESAGAVATATATAEAEPTQTPEAAAAPTATAAATAPARAAATTSAGASAVAAPRVSDSSGASASGSVAGIREEVSALQEAQQALQAGAPERAVEVLDAHARAHPPGVLAEEHAAVRLIALCRAGRAAEVRGEVERFAQTRPGSPLRERVRIACAR